jgi:hypothetical protein
VPYEGLWVCPPFPDNRILARFCTGGVGPAVRVRLSLKITPPHRVDSEPVPAAWRPSPKVDAYQATAVQLGESGLALGLDRDRLSGVSVGATRLH